MRVCSSNGGSGISTFTKNNTLAETLKVIEEVITKESKTVEEGNFEHIKRFIKGNYLFGLESTSSFLETLLFFDHSDRKYEEIYFHFRAGRMFVRLCPKFNFTRFIGSTARGNPI